jgi:L-lactate permease
MAKWRWSLAQLGPLDIHTNGLSIDINAANGDFGAFGVPVA